jgi:hypothetical protein
MSEDEDLNSPKKLLIAEGIRLHRARKLMEDRINNPREISDFCTEEANNSGLSEGCSRKIKHLGAE